MFEKILKFDQKKDADLFDQHILDFLKNCEVENKRDEACLFSTRALEHGFHVRVVKTDNPRMLGKLLNFMTLKNFSSSVFCAHQKEGVEL